MINFIEEYILQNKELIILISGLSGSKKSSLAKEMYRDFKLKLINLDDYCDNNKVPVIEVLGEKIKDWDDIISYDWNKFNNHIEKYKNNGCIIYGDAFPTDKLTFETNFHIHITVLKERLVEKRREFIEKNPELCKDMMIFLDKLSSFINKVTYSHYIENRKKSKINLWINSDEDSIDVLYDKSFEFIMNGIKKFLDEYYSIHKRNIDFIKEDKIKKLNDKNIKNKSKSKEIIHSDTDSDTDNIYDSDSDNYSDSDSEIEEKEPIMDELDKVYKEEMENAISLGKYNDPVAEAQFLLP